MTVLISFSIMLALAAGFSVWVALGLGGLVGLTGGIAAFCQSIFVQCLAYSHVAKVVFLWLGALTFASGLIWGFYRGAGRLLRAHMAVKRLPVRAAAGSIVLVDIEKRSAFTHGLLNPKIYLSRGLLKGLEHEELKGVLYHELHHKRGLDPLKFFLVNLLMDTFFYIPLARLFSERVHDTSEAAADSSAARRLCEPLSLASALVKVARDCHGVYAPAALTGDGKGRPGSVEARVRRLIDGDRIEAARPGLRPLAVSVLVTALLLFSFTLPMSTGVRSVEACTTAHCSSHMDRLGQDCAAHCEPHGTAHHR